MEICRSIAAMRATTARWRSRGQAVALVPTMGALHQGHLTLVARARDWVVAQGGGCIVTSIFVNPTQFGPNEDLSKYPRDEAGDLKMLRQAGCDAVFLPQADEIWRPGARTVVDVTGLSRILMGRLRPGHFQGVASVVTKLFNITGADAAVFGEKDYQQLALIQQMVSDLDVPINIIGVPTVREEDGLAMSSRNRRLTPTDRAAAPVLSRALDQAEAMIAQGAALSAVHARLRAILRAEPKAQIRSVDIRDARDLSRITAIAGPVVILLAVRFGDVLLLDQRVAHP